MGFAAVPHDQYSTPRRLCGTYEKRQCKKFDIFTGKMSNYVVLFPLEISVLHKHSAVITLYNGEPQLKKTKKKKRTFIWPYCSVYYVLIYRNFVLNNFPPSQLEKISLNQF